MGRFLRFHSQTGRVVSSIGEVPEEESLIGEDFEKEFLDWGGFCEYLSL